MQAYSSMYAQNWLATGVRRRTLPEGSDDQFKNFQQPARGLITYTQGPGNRNFVLPIIQAVTTQQSRFLYMLIEACFQLSINTTCTPDLPIMPIRRKYNTRTRICITRHPCTMDCKQHQHHHESNEYNALHIHTNSFLWRFFFFCFLWLANLEAYSKWYKCTFELVKS